MFYFTHLFCQLQTPVCLSVPPVSVICLGSELNQTSLSAVGIERGERPVDRGLMFGSTVVIYVPFPA